MKFFLLFLIAAVVLCFGCGKRETTEIPAVKDFDINRYCGKWYEIARLPNWFENGMSGVSANYSLNHNGTVKVVNSGMKNGKIHSVTGTAELAGKTNEGELKVSFMWPFRGSYRIIKLATDYSVAVVCGKSYNYLWILARKPEISLADLDEILKFLQPYGFNIANLEFPQQKNGGTVNKSTAAQR